MRKKTWKKGEELANQTVLQPQNVNAILETAESGDKTFKENPRLFFQHAHSGIKAEKHKGLDKSEGAEGRIKGRIVSLMYLATTI